MLILRVFHSLFANAMFGHYGLKRPSELTRFKASSTVSSGKTGHHFPVYINPAENSLPLHKQICQYLLDSYTLEPQNFLFPCFYPARYYFPLTVTAAEPPGPGCGTTATASKPLRQHTHLSRRHPEGPPAKYHTASSPAHTKAADENPAYRNA